MAQCYSDLCHSDTNNLNLTYPNLMKFMQTLKCSGSWGVEIELVLDSFGASWDFIITISQHRWNKIPVE